MKTKKNYREAIEALHPIKKPKESLISEAINALYPPSQDYILHSIEGFREEDLVRIKTMRVVNKRSCKITLRDGTYCFLPISIKSELKVRDKIDPNKAVLLWVAKNTAKGRTLHKVFLL